MPIYFPGLDPDGKPIEVAHYPVDEAAPKLHVGRKRLREKARRDQWPHLTIGGRYFFSDEHLAEIIEMQTVRPGLGQWRDTSKPGTTRLGIVASPEEAEGGVR